MLTKRRILALLKLISVSFCIVLLQKTYVRLWNHSTPIGQTNRTLETRIRCIGPLINQSCLFENLYYINGDFIILTVNGTLLPDYSVRTNSLQLWPKVRQKRVFDSYPSLEHFVRTIAEPTIIPDVTVYFIQDWQYNIGHALFDGLYPAYLALIRFSPRHLHPFRLFTDFRDCDKCWTEDIYQRFSGLPMIKELQFMQSSTRRWFMFEEIVMGSGMMCQRCTQTNFQLPGGIDLDGSRLFRDRMYRQHGLLPPRVRHRSSSEYRTSSDVLHTYVIHNKRFHNDDIQQIQNAIAEINNYTHSFNKKQQQQPLIHISYLHYEDVPLRNLTPSLFQDNKFIAQLRLLRQMDIHISAPGTGQMYQTFLPDGSIHINLGGLKPDGLDKTKQVFTSFGEQYMTSGTPYIKGLYYPINERVKGIRQGEVVRLVRQAAKLILDGFAIPVNPYDNLANDGQLFIEMCAKDPVFCSLVTTRPAQTHFPCFNFWIEELIHEYRQWKVGGVIDNQKNLTCIYNQTLLRQLRQKYGITHDYSF
ncbi:unnamed protein product [Adineta ricciae]|uniref:Uncharacterized protein n=1 Tax=Adineta ricciae TaxID=249248 RepID=A0A815GU30_ADIRI|nr:unnamed protein product [Adineta ricciae]CAF1343322.1 unnamed protein product [Adineta ricciae]